LIFDDVYKDPPILGTFYALLLSAVADKSQRRSGGLTGNLLLPIEEARTQVDALVASANEARQHCWYRPVFRDATGKRLVGSWCLWADIDPRSTDPKENEAKLAKLWAFEPKPSYIAWSGNGYHAVWMLNSFCTDMKLLGSKLVGIRIALDADKQQSVPKGGLRVPGNINWKWYAESDPGASTCRVIPGGTGAAYPIEAFPDGEMTMKDRKANAPGSFRALFGKYFPNVSDPSKEEWYVICPWHDDTSPSMSVNVDKGVWTCGGCGLKGTAVAFYQRMEGINYADAKKILSELPQQKSLVDLLEDHLRSIALPIMRQGSNVVVAKRNEDGSPGTLIEFNTGSRSGMRAALSLLMDGGPCHQAQQMISDDISLQQLVAPMEEACMQLGSELPQDSDINVLGQGLHFYPDDTFLVDGGKMHRWASMNVPVPGNAPNGQWVNITSPIYNDKYVLLCPDNWKPWYPSPERTSIIPPSLCMEALEKIQRTCWFHSDPMDPVWIALYSMYLPVWHIFPSNPIHLQVTAESASGKSALTEGWFGGNIPEAIQMTPGVSYLKNATAAYIYQTYDKSHLPIVFDEIQDHESWQGQALVELVRNMEGKGGPVNRGTQDGKRAKRYNVMFPTIWSGIKLPELVQDMNRRLIIRLPKMDPAPMNPWQKMLETWTRLDLTTLSKAVTDTMVAYAPELKRRYADQVIRLRAVQGNAFRMAQRMIPLLTIADLCGLDTKVMTNALLDRVNTMDEATLEASPGEAIRQNILFTNLQVIGMDGNTNLSKEIADRTVGKYAQVGGIQDFAAPDRGLYYFRAERKIGVCPTRYRFGDARNSRWGPTNIGRLLTALPGFEGYMYRTIDGVSIRVYIFDAKTFIGGFKPGNGIGGGSLNGTQQNGSRGVGSPG